MFNKIIHITILLIALLAFSVVSFSQEKKLEKKKTKPTVVKIDTTANTKSLLKNHISKKKKSNLKGFIDKNANGIDDRLETKKGMGKGKLMGRRDVFIDKNGDGICDGRESAIGLKKTMRHRMGKK